MTEAVKRRPEEERLLALLRRADALNIAFGALECEEWGHPGAKAEMLAALEEMRVEAEAQFKAYRQELGVPDPLAYTDDQGGVILRGAPPPNLEERTLDEEWARTQQDYVMWELAMIVVIKRTGAFAVHTATVEGDEGLLIFQSHLDAQAYREDSGLFAGYGVVGVDEARIAGLLARYGLRWVALADPWHESEGLVVTTFEVDRFLKLLDEAIKH